jgi:hypothetical protein
MADMPRELRGVSPDPVRRSSTPSWVRLTALLVVVAMVAFALFTAF